METARPKSSTKTTSVLGEKENSTYGYGCRIWGETSRAAYCGENRISWMVQLATRQMNKKKENNNKQAQGVIVTQTYYNRLYKVSSFQPQILRYAKTH